MASSKLTARTEPNVIPHTRASVRSRLPPLLRVPILVVLSLGLNTALWSFASNFLTPELGEISKIPDERDLWSMYSPLARLAIKITTIWMTWYFNYDFEDVTALTILIQAPFTYLLSTFYNITTQTISAHVLIEVLSIAVPTYLLRPRAAKHDANVTLRNRFLLNSAQVQLSNSLLALGVYIAVIWAALKTGFLNRFLIEFFDVQTFENAYLETPISLFTKVFFAGLAAKEFLLNSSIAAQPPSGTATPIENFVPATATLPQTIKQNVWYFSKQTRTLIQQTAILNAFLFANTVQRCMTLTGTDFSGAAGYASVWMVANAVLALWYAWVGDTSANYEPL